MRLASTVLNPDEPRMNPVIPPVPNVDLIKRKECRQITLIQLCLLVVVAIADAVAGGCYDSDKGLASQVCEWSWGVDSFSALIVICLLVPAWWVPKISDSRVFRVCITFLLFISMGASFVLAGLCSRDASNNNVVIPTFVACSVMFVIWLLSVFLSRE